MSFFVNERIAIADDEIDFAYSRSSGPGGQHVNKTESRVQLRFAVFRCRALNDTQKRLIAKAAGRRLTAEGEIVMACGRHRVRSRNRDEVLERLRALIVEAITPRTPRKKTKPTRSSQRRRIEAKNRRGAIKRRRQKPGLDD